MLRSILVPLDGSTFAEHALTPALTLARRAVAPLVLVAVSTPLAEAYVEGVYFDTIELEKEEMARHQDYLQSVAERLRQRATIPVVIRVEHGEVAATLCKLLEAGEADLVVMATHGRGALGRFWLGSVADEMIRHSPVPLMLVRPQQEEVELEQEYAPGRVVLPLDGTKLAEQILEPAIAVVSLIPACEITLLRAIHPVVPVDSTPDVPEARKEARLLLHQVQANQSRLRQEAEQYLEGVAERLRQRGLKVQTRVVAENHPAQAILHEADAMKASLIALETHGRRGLSRLILGSVADKVIRGAHMPVLVHRPKHE